MPDEPAAIFSFKKKYCTLIDARNVILWTCVTVFIITCVITLLGIIRVLSIPETYLTTLFRVLIVEIIAVALWSFKASVQKEFLTKDEEFVRITSPLPGDYSLNADTHEIYAGGVYLKADNSHNIRVSATLNNAPLAVENLLPNAARNMFSARIPFPAGSPSPGELTIEVDVQDVDGTKVICSSCHDEIVVKLK